MAFFLKCFSTWLDYLNFARLMVSRTSSGVVRYRDLRCRLWLRHSFWSSRMDFRHQLCRYWSLIFQDGDWLFLGYGSGIRLSVAAKNLRWLDSKLVITTAWFSFGKGLEHPLIGFSHPAIPVWRFTVRVTSYYHVLPAGHQCFEVKLCWFMFRIVVTSQKSSFRLRGCKIFGLMLLEIYRS